MRDNFVQVGVASCGSFGTAGNAPFGYVTREECGTPALSRLGFVADVGQDGWNVGTPTFCGDYFLPGSEIEGWGIQFNGNDFFNSNTGVVCANFDVPGTVTAVNGLGPGDRTTMWRGTVAGMDVKQFTRIPHDSMFFITDVILTNTTAATMNNVYYARWVDPDNDRALDGGVCGTYQTVNTVVGAGLVTAVGVGGPGCFLGLGSQDATVQAAIRGAGIGGPASVSDIANLVGGWSTVGSTADVSVGLGYDLGDLPPGESFCIRFTYVLNAADVAGAIAGTGAFAVTSNGTDISSTLTDTICPGDSVTLCVDGPNLLHVQLVNR